MRIAMVYTLVSPSSPQKNCALSIIYPGRAAEEAGHKVSFWDARLEDDNDVRLWKNIENANVVAISSLSGFQLGESIQVAKKCREKFPQKPIIWGGVHVTFQPIESLRENFVDFVVIGEGEIRFPRLLKAIETGCGFKDIDGIGYKLNSVGFKHSKRELSIFESNKSSVVGGVKIQTTSGGRELIKMYDSDGVYENSIVIRKRELSIDLKNQYIHPVSPTTERLFRAAAERNEVMLQEARGCNWSPTSCEFCSVAGQYTEIDPITGKNRSVYRYIPYEHFKRDIYEIYAIKPFTFLQLEAENSSHFIKDWRYAELLQSLGIKYHLHLRSDQLTKENVIAKLASTGCIRIHAGMESGNDETLKLMRKGEKVSAHYAAAKLLSKYDVGLIATWIVGNPGESEASIMDTLRVSDDIKNIFSPTKSRATVYVLMPLPGTIAFERAKKEGWPLPKTMGGWTEMSAAFNPQLPAWINNLYFIAGFHHNRYHKARQNWPGWWRLLILPFEFIIEKRWQLGIKYKDRQYFEYFNFEYWCITRLLKWRSKRSVGETQSQLPKLLERLMPGLAGH